MIGWIVVAAGIAFAVLTAAVTIQTKRLAAVKQEFAAFQGGVEALGKKARDEAIATAKRDFLRKEKADEDVTRRLAGLSATVARLRNERAGGSFLPAPAPSPGGTAGASLDWAQSERALRKFDQGAQGLVDEGSETVIKLDEAKRWAQEKR
jgi:hypothetical protein